MHEIINSLKKNGLVLEKDRFDVDKKSLDLSNLELTDSQYEIIINALSSNIDIAYFNLSSTNLNYGRIMELIDAVFLNNKLTNLNLSCNTVGNIALHHLVSLLEDRPTSLVKLNLAHNIIGEVGNNIEVLQDIEFLKAHNIEVDLTGNTNLG